jgi:hypothetical protein
MRYLPAFKPEVEIATVPGAHFKHIERILERSDVPSHLREVIVAVGMCHREDSFQSHSGIVASARSIIKKVGDKSTARVRFLGVSVPADGMRDTEVDHLLTLNERLECALGDQYILPLSPMETSVEDGCHYDSRTLTSLSKLVAKSF